MALVFDNESVSTTAPKKLVFDDEPKSVGGFAKNLGKDIFQTGTGAVQAAAQFPVFMQKRGLHDIQSLGQVATGTPLAETKTAKDLATMGKTALGVGKGLVGEAQRIGLGKLATGHPIEAAQQFGEAAYEKPLTTGLDVLPVVGAAGKALGGAGRAVGILPDTAKAAQIGATAADAGKAAQMGAEGTAAAESIPTGATFADTVQNLGKKIPESVKGPMGEVGQFLESKYGNVAKRPGWPQTLADYAKEFSENMTLKEMGASSGQLRKIGMDEARDLARYAQDKGLIDMGRGTIGRENAVGSALETNGKTIGGIREIATKRGAVHNMDSVIEKIKSNLDEKYTKGMHSGQKGTYNKALAELKKLNGSPDEVAKKITEFYKEARKQDPLREAAGPYADVAAELRNLNEGLIKKHLSPKEVGAYETALDDFGAMKQIREFILNRARKEASGRLPPGSGIVRSLVQGFLDTMGYKGAARMARKFSDFITKNPGAASNPRAMLSHFIDNAVEAIDDIGTVPQ